MLSLSGERSLDWPDGYSVHATSQLAPSNGTCASAEAITPPATLSALSNVGAPLERFDHCTFVTEHRTRFYTLEVPPGATLQVTVTSTFLGGGGSPAEAFVLDGCAVSSDQCLAERGGGIPARTRWTNPDASGRSVVVALTSGTALTYDAAFSITGP